MPEIKTWIHEFIQEDDVVRSEIGEFLTAPVMDEDAKFEALVGKVKYRGARRSLNINKGNAKRIAEVFGSDTDAWVGKRFRIRLPETADEKASRTKLIIEAEFETAIPELKPLGKEQRIAALKAKGVSDEQIKNLDEIGAL